MRLDVRRIPGRVRIEATSAPAAEQHNNRSQRALSDVDAGGNRCMREPTKFRCKVVRVEAAATMIWMQQFSRQPIPIVMPFVVTRPRNFPG